MTVVFSLHAATAKAVIVKLTNNYNDNKIVDSEAWDTFLLGAVWRNSAYSIIKSMAFLIAERCSGGQRKELVPGGG